MSTPSAVQVMSSEEIKNDYSELTLISDVATSNYVKWGHPSNQDTFTAGCRVQGFIILATQLQHALTSIYGKYEVTSIFGILSL